jgi:hypothetical protein
MTQKLTRKKSTAFISLKAQEDIIGNLEDIYSKTYDIYSQIEDPDEITTEEEKQDAAAFYEAQDKLEEAYQEFFRRYDKLTKREQKLLEKDFEGLPFSYMYAFDEKFRAVTKFESINEF